MDIGPVRRRFTAEPVSSPVPGETSPVHEPAMVERVASVSPSTGPDRDTAESSRT